MTRLDSPRTTRRLARDQVMQMCDQARESAPSAEAVACIDDALELLARLGFE